ncbi:MAG: helix-turn-helix domain-containing protein [Niveispirillum sp.]|uniref:helix-turn-helix domain-containing protein n=1 Tax=Niveispirillum sp. TaxID=1917217 RepID=UPI003BA76ECD
MTGQAFASVWDTIEGDPALRAGLKLRSELMDVIEAHLARQGWEPAVAAQHLGISLDRLTAFQRGQIDRFSMDDLLVMATALGLEFHIQVGAAA